MDRWIESFAQLCDVTVTSVASCCTTSNNGSFDAVKMVPLSPSRPRAHQRIDESSLLSDATTVLYDDAYWLREVSSPPDPPHRRSGLAPNAVHFYTFREDALNAQVLSSSSANSGATIDAAAAGHGIRASEPPTEDAVRAGCFGPLRSRSRTSPGRGAAAAGRAAPARESPPAPPASAQAVHRAAMRGNAEMLRFVLRPALSLLPSLTPDPLPPSPPLSPRSSTLRAPLRAKIHTRLPGRAGALACAQRTRREGGWGAEQSRAAAAAAARHMGFSGPGRSRSRTRARRLPREVSKKDNGREREREKERERERTEIGRAHV